MFLCPQPKKLELKKGFYKFEVGTEPKKEIKITPLLAQKESYRIEIDENGVHIEAADKKGVYYAGITLNQLMKNYRGCLPFIYIYDEPEFYYRGFMIDTCRHFFSVEELKKMINAASYFKFNKFHFHLTDDQGFRIELESYPEITAIGSVRKGSHFGKSHDDNETYGGYYTKQELKEIVEYCEERFIEVIPEFDVPGHTSALLAAMPQLSCNGEEVEVKETAGIFPDVLCVGKEETFKVICDIFDEICDIFPGEYIHIGGDEVPKANWNGCPVCQAKREENGFKTMEELQGKFTSDLSFYLKKKGKKAICWNEAIRGGNVEKDNITVAWWMDKTDATIDWANNGGPIILENFAPFYVDYPYGMHSLRDIYTFNPQKIKSLTDLGRSSVVGVESPIWTEFVIEPETMHKLCFPRWFAVSEIAWNGGSERDFAAFLKTSQFFCEVLNEMGITAAHESEWNILPHTRLSQTLNFATKNISKKTIIDFLRGNNK